MKLLFKIASFIILSFGSCIIENVKIFHLIDNSLWGEIDGSGLSGDFKCSHTKCSIETTTTNQKEFILSNIHEKVLNFTKSQDYLKTLTVSLYNIHTWGTISKWPHKPATCILNTNVTIAESEESFGRFNHLFKNSFPQFDGNSTTNPTSSIPRIYFEGKFKENAHLYPFKDFNSLIKAGVYVASSCHKGPKTSKREQLVYQIEKKFRIDSLGKCHKTSTGPEGIILKSSADVNENLFLKRKAISNYLFYLAFENTIEPGYVSEKVYDALIAGVVPIYFGDSVHCKKLIPFEKSVIYVDDYDDMDKLTLTLQYLSNNESAYEEYRSAWRVAKSGPRARLYYKHLSEALHESRDASNLILEPWPCRICKWASETYPIDSNKVNRNCNVFEPKI